MLSYWLLAHTFTGWEFVQACTFSTSVVYALGVQRHCCKNMSFNINVYSTFNITFVTKDLTVTISYRIWYTVLGKGLVPPFILYTVFIGMWGIVFFYPGIARWFKIVLFCFHHSISVDMIQTPLSEMQRKSWQLPAKISNLVSSLTLSLCFQPTSNWDSFWWGFRLSGPYSLFSCFLKKWLRLSSAVDSFSGLPLFWPYTLLKFSRKPSTLGFFLLTLLELSCCYKNTLLCFFIKKLELIMYFSQKLLVTKCLKILGSLLSRLQTQHWFIPWVRCTFNDWFIHRPLLYDLTNKQAKKKKATTENNQIQGMDWKCVKNNVKRKTVRDLQKACRNIWARVPHWKKVSWAHQHSTLLQSLDSKLSTSVKDLQTL